MSDSEDASDSADSDAPAFVPKPNNKYGPPRTAAAPPPEDPIDKLLEEDSEELREKVRLFFVPPLCPAHATQEARAKEEKRHQDEALARAAAWDKAKKEAAEQRRLQQETERAAKLKEAHAQAGVGSGAAKERPQHEELDEEGFPVYSPRALEAMETGQIVIQFLQVQDVKPGGWGLGIFWGRWALTPLAQATCTCRPSCCRPTSSFFTRPR